MRRLHINQQTGPLLQPLHVSEEFKFIAHIARMYATEIQGMEALYKVGRQAAKDYQDKCIGDTANRNERFAAWVVKQSIVEVCRNKVQNGEK